MRARRLRRNSHPSRARVQKISGRVSAKEDMPASTGSTSNPCAGSPHTTTILNLEQMLAHGPKQTPTPPADFAISANRDAVKLARLSDAHTRAPPISQMPCSAQFTAISTVRRVRRGQLPRPSPGRMARLHRMVAPAAVQRRRGTWTNENAYGNHFVTRVATPILVCRTSGSVPALRASAPSPVRSSPSSQGRLTLLRTLLYC